MFRLSTLIFIVFISLVGAGVFHLKYEVASLEKHHQNLLKSITSTKSQIHVLRVEWAHLNDPLHLQKLAEAHLEAKPIEPHQVISLKSQEDFFYQKKEPLTPITVSENNPSSPLSKTENTSLKREGKPEVRVKINIDKLVSASSKRKSLDHLIAKINSE